MNSHNSCEVCGNKDMALIDGFYYCVECGTQDTNVRETVVEKSIFADGTTAYSTRKKILKISEDKVEMTGEWYKWHIYNFILCGLADELIELGAKPSFKMKLLWVWSNYIRKYQIKDDLGLTCNINEEMQSKLPGKSKSVEKIPSENDAEDRSNGNSGLATKYVSRQRDIRAITCGLLVSMLYTALNLDKSELQTSHLFRYIKEGRLDITDFSRHIPDDINTKLIPDWPYFVRSCSPRRLLSSIKCRWMTMALLNQLEIGPPVLPDMRNIVNNFITELCLPNEFKNLVLSLMYSFHSIKLQISNDDLNNCYKMPDYESIVMAYIIVALKICFGLDDDYEYRLSKAVDKINENEKYCKSYKLGFASNKTDRLFSFEDWIKYLQFRRKILSVHCMLDTGDEHYLDMDDYIYLEYLPDKQNNKIDLIDELSMNILDKIPQNNDISIIPKVDFGYSLTPLSAYTEVIANHSTDSNHIMLLSEEFSKYSLKYTCENLQLIDFDTSSNLIKGVDGTNKVISNCELMAYDKKLKYSKDIEMVIVRNCDNKNWIKTNKPTLEHIVDEKNEIHDEKASDQGYDSNENSSDKDVPTESVSVVETDKFETIEEEDEDKNIFDDDFLVYEIKTEPEDSDHENMDPQRDENDIFNDDFDDRNPDMDDSKSVHSYDSFEFNPETFNRERAIKELILKACKTYKIPIPKEYRTTEPRKRKSEFSNNEAGVSKRRRTEKRGEAKIQINKLLEAYYSQMERDVVTQVAHELKNVIWNLENAKNVTQNLDDKSHVSLSTETPAASFVGADEGAPNDTKNEQEIDSQNTSATDLRTGENTTLQETKLEIVEENEPKLFDDDSDVDVDELIPKTNPKFDENEYDISQLYMKIGKIETEDICDSIKDAQLTKIIDKNIEDYKAGKIIKQSKGVDERSNDSTDSEDEVPLIVFKEANLKEPLIKLERIQDFKYWFRHYKYNFMVKADNRKEKFEFDLIKNTPKTFYFLLKECALISDSTPFRIYKCLSRIEQSILRLTKT